MPSPLIIPGVQVKTVFEPAGALPSITGVLGVVGIADRGPLAPTQVGNMAEFLDAFGPGSRYSMPEVKTAFANGVSRMVIARLGAGPAQKASLTLQDDDGDDVVKLIARAEGAWGNGISVQVQQVRTLSGRGVKFINLTVLYEGQVQEVFNNLVLDEYSPDYLFDRINSQSRLIVAVDPLFTTDLPPATAKTTLATATSRAAAGGLKSGQADVVRAEAKAAGHRGNGISISVAEGQAGLALTGAGGAPSVDVRAKAPGGTDIRITVVPGQNNAVSIVFSRGADTRTLGPFADVDALVAGLKADADLTAEKTGTVLPTGPIAPTALGRRVRVQVLAEGADPAVYDHVPTLDAIAALSDPFVTFTTVQNATALPDAQALYLTGGRDQGAALELTSQGSPGPLLEIAAANPDQNVAVQIASGKSTIDNSTSVANITVFQDDAVVETYTDLTMDPDDPLYLPRALEGSALVRAHDLFVRSRSVTFPKSIVRAATLTGGTAPLQDDYQAALDRLESAEEVDMVIASCANQFDDAGVRAIHKAVAAHCTKMADVARNRIGLGSPTTSEHRDPAKILDHANDVRSDYFILSTPAKSEAAVAGLLARQDYFQSPTFKTIANLDTAEVPYTDSQLEKLITGNVLAIARRRNLGVIVVKGLLTSGRQVNVQRTANKSVRDVKAICDNYIGLLNNEGSRNSLRQQIIALFLQMERDGAIVPSTDGKDPSFQVGVYSTQADFANGIVRVDIAIRPVRAIDYIYATILVRN